MAYRVDNIPLLLKPLFLLYSWVVALLSYGLNVLIRLTCRFTIVGDELPAGVNNAVYAIWHENLFPYFIFYLTYQQPYAWMNHPLWYMKPVHLILRFMGLKKLYLGSSGHDGKNAMLNVVEQLQNGYNTLIACDGPAGPYKALKSGVLEMSRLSGIPVIPIQFHLSKHWTLSGWDKKKFPLPFSTISVEYRKPIFITAENYEEMKIIVAKEMG